MKHGALYDPEHVKGLWQPIVSIDYIIFSAPGDVVYVPAGWAHSVTNIRRNVKIAFDIYDGHHYHLYAATAAAASTYFGEANIADYMQVPEVLRSVLRVNEGE
jgi:oxalate decarboxylase/phosphoglucose isomerase-like protein (cupin superfamily)